MRVDVSVDLVVGDLHLRIGNPIGKQRDMGHLHGIVLVLPRLPEPRVGDECAGRDLVDQLAAPNRVAVIALEVEVEARLARHRRPPEPTVLLDVELSVGLKVGRLHQRLWGRVIGGEADLVVRDRNPAAVVLPLEQDVGDHLVEDPLLENAALIGVEGATRPLPFRFLGLLERPLPVQVRDLLPFDLSHGCAAGHGRGG
jgi:tetrahydromethanopterin S-methyltransferase subunit G